MFIHQPRLAPMIIAAPVFNARKASEFLVFF